MLECTCFIFGDKSSSSCRCCGNEECDSSEAHDQLLSLLFKVGSICKMLDLCEDICRYNLKFSREYIVISRTKKREMLLGSEFRLDFEKNAKNRNDPKFNFTNFEMTEPKTPT